MDKKQGMDREKRNEAVSSCSAWQILEYFFPSASYPGVLRQQNVAADVKKLLVQPLPLQQTISQLIKILWQSQSLLKPGEVNIWIALLKNQNTDWGGHTPFVNGILMHLNYSCHYH